MKNSAAIPTYLILVPPSETVLWESFLLETVGGFTVLPPTFGAWLDSNSKAHYDHCRPYLVACRPEQFRDCVAKAHKLWPNEQAIFYVELGPAYLSYRD